MKLRSGHSVWLDATSRLPHYPRLERSVRCDVAVIGGGITGAMAAYDLVRGGFSVVLVDRREIGRGSTSASTALLTYETDVHLGDLKKRFGVKAAVRVYQLGREAIDRIEALTQEIGDPCGFSRRPSYYFASRPRDARILQREALLRRRHGFRVDFLDRKAARALPFTPLGAIRTPDAGEINPLRFTLRLIERAKSSGLRVFAHTGIKSFDSTPSGIVLRAQTGGSIHARRVIFATGYESQQFLPLPSVTLSTTYVAASRPIEQFTGWPERALLWETARPYVYLRTDEAGRAIIGGEDEVTRGPVERGDLYRKAALLTRRFRRMFPEIPFHPERVWSGVFAESTDGLPYIGEVQKFPGAFFCLGYGGNGITFGAIAAAMLCERCKGKSSRDLSLFSFDR